MSRRIGISGLQRQTQEREAFRDAGNALAVQQLEQLQAQLASFKTHLEAFAVKHRSDIQRDPIFRAQFQRMCNNIGVDPLASKKGFWTEMLGFGDFYYELGIQIAECCLATREKNGGVIELTELKRLVERTRGKSSQPISEDDILQSIKSMAALGSGFDIVTVGGKRVVISVPKELNSDLGTLLLVMGQFTTAAEAASTLGWETQRVQQALDELLRDGICWVDEQAQPAQYWVSGLFGGL
ncbi:EAP30/Vps36 family-domain-containing protein [Polychytrium aggregatum]|uniref:EAP30/Vps36 family-domain-containing protein n=1 Tax=Polychytrium aggregatum TaxID=110093 RepID=UPI0022FF0B72|nr:EAP30/Vps36 family-domain-containing protein [Polychytrium aggregatum]KAI9206041.1 EAP30/Vps36 family-domain-containing protein [Polychytrium aggregatum]